MSHVKPVLPAPPRKSFGHAPMRVPGSVRRTSTIEVSWPDGLENNMRLMGRARDILTPRNGGAPVVCAEDSYVATLKPDRTIVAIESQPARPVLSQIVGERGGGHLRWKLADIVSEERTNGTPLYLILDDISGTSLVGGFARVVWNPKWMIEMRGSMSREQYDKYMAEREGVCIGFAPGSSALETSRPEDGPHGTQVPDLRDPADPNGWHAFTDQAGAPGMRRARRIDVRMDDVIKIDAMFQDSATSPQGGRVAVHEYAIAVTADPQSLKVLSIKATPYILPFPECPSAIDNMRKLLGTPLPELRDKVLAELKKTAGCTHLNDAMRSLAEVPALVKHLNTI